MKGNVCKVHRLYNDKVISGFAGDTTDAFTLFERKLKVYQSYLIKSAVELAKDWRTDLILSRLKALLVVVDENVSLIINENDGVVQPENDLIAIGAGGPV